MDPHLQSEAAGLESLLALRRVLGSWFLELSVLRFGPPSREGCPLCQHSEDGGDRDMTPPPPGRLVIVSTQWTADALHEITATPR